MNVNLQKVHKRTTLSIFDICDLENDLQIQNRGGIHPHRSYYPKTGWASIWMPAINKQCRQRCKISLWLAY